MSDQLPIVGFTQASEEKDCHRSTIHRAVERGELNAVPFQKQRAILRDEKYEAWQPKKKHATDPSNS
jgi:hypothetical protein